MAIKPIPGMDHFPEPHTVPQLYWDVMSSEQRIHAICDAIEQLFDEIGNDETLISKNAEAIAELDALFKKFQESGFDDYYAEQVEKWIDEHMTFVFDHTIKQVFFGLTSDGYFCAYVPDSWSDIQFDTGMNYGTTSYGRLILRYEADGSGVIDNTNYGNPGSIEPYNDLKADVEKLRQTVYTALKAGE